MENMTKQLLLQAKAIATEVLGTPSEETIRAVFLRLCDEHDAAPPEFESGDARTVH